MTEIDIRESTVTEVSPVYNGSTTYVPGVSCAQWATGITIATYPREEQAEYHVAKITCTNLPGNCPSQAAIQDFNSDGGISVELDAKPTTRLTAANVARHICSQAVSCPYN